MKEPIGRDADNIAFGSVLSNDRHAGRTFDYLIANPPYGKDWKRDEDVVTAESERGKSGRFAPGLPRISDGQLLFLLHMLSHVKEAKEGGSRIAIIMNGSPLFTGDAGSGESEIRRHVLDTDLLEALIALPEQLFYNTGIATYVWVLTNRKAPERRGKVQLIDATSYWIPMRKSLGDKVKICVEHFATHSQGEIGGKAKAMIVTRSRLHAVRYKLAVDRYLAERGYPFKALVAFSGTVKDGGKDYTESKMNSQGEPQSIGEAQTAKTFERPEYRFLIVANKFQTGFDQPLLHTMYVDKKLGGVNAVQTLSRLNRTHPEKKGTLVLDFANEADEIKAAFEPYYETTLLSEATDPNLLYEIQTRLAAFSVYTAADVEAFAKVYFDLKATQDRLYAVLAPVVERFQQVSEEERADFRGQVTDYVRLYAFLAQVLTFADPDLEKLYAFVRHLRRLLPSDREVLPREEQQNIDMESYRIQQTASGKIALERKPGVLDPAGTRGAHSTSTEELETLSRIIAELNERFGLHLGPEHRVTLGQMMEKLDDDAALDAAARVNTRENVRLTFDQKVEHVIQEIVDSNFELYKRITDDRGFGEAIKNLLFDQYLRAHRNAEELIKRGESKTLEFKSTLRWSLKEDRQDDKGVTHAALKTIAAFLNTEGGDLLLGVADDGSIVGIERDQLENDDKFMRHLSQVVRNGLGDRAGTCIDPKTQIVQGKTVCVVSCQRSPEPVFLKWKGIEATAEGDFYVRSRPGTVKLPPESSAEYIRTRFGAGRTGQPA
jgi:hypothetical protein